VEARLVILIYIYKLLAEARKFYEAERTKPDPETGVSKKFQQLPREDGSSKNLERIVALCPLRFALCPLPFAIQIAALQNHKSIKTETHNHDESLYGLYLPMCFPSLLRPTRPGRFGRLQ
jgi:hypothetical protein